MSAERPPLPREVDHVAHRRACDLDEPDIHAGGRDVEAQALGVDPSCDGGREEGLGRVVDVGPGEGGEELAAPVAEVRLVQEERRRSERRGQVAYVHPVDAYDAVLSAPDPAGPQGRVEAVHVVRRR